MEHYAYLSCMARRSPGVRSMKLQRCAPPFRGLLPPTTGLVVNATKQRTTSPAYTIDSVRVLSLAFTAAHSLFCCFAVRHSHCLSRCLFHHCSLDSALTDLSTAVHIFRSRARSCRWVTMTWRQPRSSITAGRWMGAS